MDDTPLRYIDLTSDELKQQREQLKKLLHDTAKPQLLSQWMTVDGKLVCKWLSR
ncbi:hypothetical protein [Limnofasciculus baicalensis]|uniref:Uncharacterized protein n=1 Tax=Limnofasciculus baicalensis BBK-W-15 TaxID=2699891 RepID=A0AAE3KMU5_9CYAN|nr:hypothetical protein [Limnofasciculus baicalensis]MCP2729599.1 hypothetical protein [Limnofasciculus baicalensis BBK-W-15]